MSIRTQCPECRAEFTLGDEMAGKRVRCKKCQAGFTVKAVAPNHRRQADEEERITTRRPAKAVPSKAPGKKRRPQEDEDESPRKSGEPNNVPWIVGGIVGGLAIVTAAVVLILALTRSEKPANQMADNQKDKANGQKPEDRKPDEKPQDKKPDDKLPEERKPEDPPNRTPGQISKADIHKVKKATVLIRVVGPEGEASTGTGFFGDPESPKLILTNAHVVGMLAPASRPPRSIQVTLNSGQSDESSSSATIKAVDRHSDLAVLEIGAVRGSLPRPLTVTSAKNLSELDKVTVFGFPLGTALGREITIRPSTVSSLRKKNGVLDRVQVNGGMDPGNSGGPVVDDSGHVVGVAVAGIPGRMINFAIPAERVREILNSRIESVEFDDIPYMEGKQSVVSVRMELIDPRRRIKEVGIEVWTSDGTMAGIGSLAPTDTRPIPGKSESTRTLVKLKYAEGVAVGDVKFPEKAPGRALMFQPVWIGTDGKWHWSKGDVWGWKMQPLRRKPALLALKWTPKATRTLSLNFGSRIQVSSDEKESLVLQLRSFATLKELVERSSATESEVALSYSQANQTYGRGRWPKSTPLATKVKGLVTQLKPLLKLDQFGGIKSTQVNDAVLKRTATGKDLLDFHEPIMETLDFAYLPLPGKTTEAGTTWKVKRNLCLETPKGVRKVPADLICTYLGRRDDVPTEPVAFIRVEGTINQAAVTGRTSGTLIVYLKDGYTRSVSMKSVLYVRGYVLTVEGKAVKLEVMYKMDMTCFRL